uniref:Integrase catalytic domain-containing protein n=1 Tax=Nothobranchius furzeri TaxID=105023 RepID=A0A1A8B6K3_NOTFU
MDDVLVWGHMQEEHDARLHAVLTKIQKAGITLNIAKCDLSKSKRHQPRPVKTEAVKRMKVPTTVSELRSFLGMVNQLGKFIPQLAERDKPLRDLLSIKNCWMWVAKQVRAFQDLKDALTAPPVLAMILTENVKFLQMHLHMAWVEYCYRDGTKNGDQKSYMSWSLTSTEQRYAQVEKEALGLTWTCERFRNFLIGKHFQLETDHKPLLSLLGSQALDTLPPRIQRFGMRLMRYSYSISHVAVKSMWTADALSRAPVTSKETTDEKELFEDTNIYVNTVVENLPASTAYLEELKDQLQRDSERQNHREPLMTTPYPGRPWQKCGADLFMLKDKTYLLVVDYASRNVEIALLTPSRADDVIAHLKSIFARHGICETLITDNGPQFSGAPFADFAKVYGFLHITSSLRYPQGNAEAERVVQVVKRLLKKAKDPYLALLSYRATLLQNGCRPAQHLMGRRIRTTIPMLPALLDPDHPDENVVELKEKERKRKDAQSYNLRHHVQNLSRLPPGQEVWVTGQKTSGVVIKEHATPHSYLVEGPHRIIRQNHRHLIPRRPSQEQGSSGTDEQQSGDAPTQQSVDLPAVTTPEQNLLKPSL